MRWFAILQFIFIAASPVVSVPSSYDTSLHFLDKRDAVCGSDFRSLVDFSSCLPNQVAFTSTPPAVTKEVLPDTESSSVPPDSQCDHTVELQVLDFVAKAAKLCDVLTAMANVGHSKQTLLQPASETISGLQNLNFLDKTVNNNKRVVVQRALKGNKQTSQPKDLAVGNYLALVKADSQKVASSLDANIATIITTAQTVLKGLPDGTTSKTGRKDKAAANKAALSSALEEYDKTKTVTAAWNNILAEAPHS
ncbi:hypothetical protein PHLCEN_2v2484 [Hermanssonia centrifuga]|uniref:Uncharacterized protein n=1 Tax=Hermanssonia centrifuga TaxID=98765 RepID=A0A2R6RLS3_9APHY|nr:hypothetical protein PHLCEN_2v2484 [Hermanssonia centrifuga]